jgi:hypothetical protein
MVYGVYTMKRKQIYVDPRQDEQLQQLAHSRKVPVSHLIREAIAEYLVEQQAPPILERPEDHPLWGIVGILDDPDAPTDGSINHDHYLYGAPKREE